MIESYNERNLQVSKWSSNNQITILLKTKKKGIKWVCVKKEELKENLFPAMRNQEKSRTWEKKKLDDNDSIWTQPRKAWMKKEGNILKQRKTFISLQ